MTYLTLSRQANRSEYAKLEQPLDRFIHNISSSTRSTPCCAERVYRNQFSAIINAKKSNDDDKCEVFLPSSAKLIISAPSVDEARVAWEELKKQVDHIFSDNDYVFKGLPLPISFVPVG